MNTNIEELYKKKYLKYKAKYLNLQRGGKLEPIVSNNWKDLICDESVNVVENGNIIFEDLKLFLNTDPSFYPSFIEGRQPETFSEEEKRKFIDFYNNQENKEWLGCQIYLYTTIKDIKSSPYHKFDDGYYFFRWLTHRLKDGEYRVFVKEAPRF
jgi:hypothetical protein